jgi:hypothetical protein
MSLVELPVECFVKETDSYQPLTGVFATEESIPGWRWDRRILPSETKVDTRYNTFLGGHSAGLRDGTKLSDWQSGTLSGCGYEQILLQQKNDSLQWVPQVSTGEYAVRWDKRPLFSDQSVSFNLSTDVTMDDRYIAQLQSEEYQTALTGSLFVAIWRRLEDFSIMTAIPFQYVDEFTPLPEYTTTVDDDGSVIWAQVSDVHNEYLVDEDRLVLFNNLKTIEVATGDRYEDYIVDSWESKGPGSADGRTLFANYFPFDFNSLRVASVDSFGNHILWEEVSSFRNSSATDYHYTANYDLGTIEMGGFQAPNLKLKTAINAFADEIEVFVEPDIFDDYLDQGVLRIGSEKIFYAEKTYTGFRNLTRGYDFTSAAAHLVGANVRDTQHGAGTTDELYISYRAVPRVDVESSLHTRRTANKTGWLNIVSSANAETNNILQILSANINLAELVLEIDRPILGGNIYGPVYYGTDTARLTARGLDANGNPVEDVDITVEIMSGVGYLDGTSEEVTKSSNSLGETYTAFHAPYSDAEVAYRVSSVSHDAGDTLMSVSGLPRGVSVEDIWVFQVLKRDPFRGTVGKPSTVLSSGASSAPNGDSYLILDGRIDDNLRGGKIYVLTTTGVKRSHVIVYSEVYTDLVTGHVNTKLYVGGPLVPAYNDGQPCWVLTEEDIEWDPIAKRGQRVVVYEWSASAAHPLTGDPGAYTPVHPNSISAGVLRFTGREFPLPDANDDEVELGAYVIIAPGETRIRAVAQDPFTNQTVTSNQLRVRISLPQYLLGVDSSGALPVPYGFKFATEEFNVGAGIGGANFLTINPKASGINQFSITGLI